MRRIWKRILVPVVVFLLFLIGFILCDSISDPDISGLIGSVALFILFPFFLVTLAWAFSTGILISIRYWKNPVATNMELNHTRTELLRKNLHNEKERYKTLSPSQKKRYLLVKLIAFTLTVGGLIMICTGIMLLISIGTVVMILGLTCFLFSSSEAYNSSVDTVKMIPVSTPITIEKIYEDIKNTDTLMGSACLARFSLMKQKCLVFGPLPGQHTGIYGYLNGSGNVFYLGEAIMDGLISDIYEEPLYEPHEIDENTSALSSVICYNADAAYLQTQLLDFFSEYFRTGICAEIPKAEPSGVYMFDEHFKLTGERFCMTDTNGRTVYEAEAVLPMKSFHLYENEQEIFYMTKELVHALATYRFYRQGHFWGVLEKELTFSRDRFVIGTTDGEFVLESMTAMAGYNYRVTLNGKIIALIMDNLSFTFRNVIFDNSVITVYDERWRDVIAALAVMAVREIHRDQESD